MGVVVATNNTQTVYIKDSEARLLVSKIYQILKYKININSNSTKKYRQERKYIICLSNLLIKYLSGV